MQLNLHFALFSLVITLILSGCATRSENFYPPSLIARNTSQTTITLRCETVAGLRPELDYVGPYFGYETNIPVANLAQDVYCSDRFKRKYPAGYVTVFGSSRIIINENCGKAAIKEKIVACEENNKIYALVRDFALKWSELYGEKYPIMTGAGPGLMLAASSGAMDAHDKNPKVQSIGYTTYFDKPVNEECSNGIRPTHERAMCGNPASAFAQERVNDKVSRVVHTGGLIFSSIVEREAAMIKHSAAIILTPGGSGTEWENFQVLEMIKSSQNKNVPVIVLGNQSHWKSFENRIADLIGRGTVNKDELKYQRAENAGDVVRILEDQLLKSKVAAAL